MYGKHFISIRDHSPAELERLIHLALELKRDPKLVGACLSGKTLGVLFNATSTRTRVSFQVAARRLGGHAEHLNASDLALANQESVHDTASVLGRFLDGLIIRLYEMDRSGEEGYGAGRRAMRTFAERSGFPIINALDDQDHPTQVMGDLVTIAERFGPAYKSKKVVLAWAYSDKQKSIGVTQSMLTATSLLGMNFTLAHPKGFEVDPDYVKFAEAAARESGARIEFSHDLREACKNADVIYTKSYKSLTLSSEEDDALKERIKDDWRVGEEHFASANEGAVYMNCLPMIRGQEVAASVADSPRSIIYDEAENLLHFRKALLASIFDADFWRHAG